MTDLKPEFLKSFYENQYEQRWRGSRNQDWTIVSIVATMTAAIILLNIKLLGSVSCLILLALMSLPIFLVVFSEVGFRILRMHQQVMRHANHIATGIENYFGVIETKGAEDSNSTHDDMYVGLVESDGAGYFTYPSKKTYNSKKPLSYKEFNSSMWEVISSTDAGNVQSAIGLLYRFFQFIAAIILLVDLWFLYKMINLGVILQLFEI